MANSPVSTIPFALEQFTTLLAGCQWPLYIFLRGIVGDDEQARDLMQDTFYDAWRTAQRGMPPFHTGVASEVGIRRWLFHVAYNRACSGLRRRRLISWLPLDSFSSTTGDGASFENQVAESQAVRAAMPSLAPCMVLRLPKSVRLSAARLKPWPNVFRAPSSACGLSILRRIWRKRVDESEPSSSIP